MIEGVKRLHILTDEQKRWLRQCYLDNIQITRRSKGIIEKQGLSLIHYKDVDPGRYTCKIEGHSIVCLSDRHRVFLRDGARCVACGVEGSLWAIERPLSGADMDKLSVNVYAVVGTDEVLLTKDHIRPKAAGGLNEMSNYQPMCATCNQAKGALVIDASVKSSDDLLQAIRAEQIRQEKEREAALLLKKELKLQESRDEILSLIAVVKRRVSLAEEQLEAMLIHDGGRRAALKAAFKEMGAVGANFFNKWEKTLQQKAMVETVLQSSSEDFDRRLTEVERQLKVLMS